MRHSLLASLATLLFGAAAALQTSVPLGPSSQAGSPGPSGQAGPADLIVHNARIYTMDVRHPTAQGMAIRGDRIAAVGTSAQVLQLKGPSTRVIDAGQAAVVPGLHDAHGHVTELGESLQDLDVRGTTGYRQIVDRVRQRAATARPGEWILGRNWDQNDWLDKQWPTHESLSAVSPVNPV